MDAIRSQAMRKTNATKAKVMRVPNMLISSKLKALVVFDREDVEANCSLQKDLMPKSRIGLGSA
jgi:hypothetical protein